MGNIVNPYSFPTFYNTTTNTYACHFDGVNDHVAVDDDDGLSHSGAGDDDDAPFSIAMWLKRDSASGNDGIFTKGSTSNNFEYRMFFVGGSAYMDIGDSSGATWTNIRRTTWSHSSTAWQHVIVTYSGVIGSAECKYYVNGSAIATASSTGTDVEGMTPGSADLIIGKLNVGGYVLGGEICQYIMWKDYEISAGEATYLYASGAAHRDPLQPAPSYSGHNSVSLWLPFQTDFDDDSGNSIAGTAGSGAALSNATVPF
jgi:hypothetical protein